MGVCNCSMFCCTFFYVPSSFAITLMGKSKLVALLSCLPGVSWLLCGSSLRCHGLVCSLWLWYFLIILTYYYYFSFSAPLSHYQSSRLTLPWDNVSKLREKEGLSTYLGEYSSDNSYFSQCMRFPIMWYVRPAKPQISLCIYAVWSEPLLIAWVFYDC